MSAVEIRSDMWGIQPENFPSPGNINCDRCGGTHNLHGDCRPGSSPFQFNTLSISHLPVKVDGHIDHLFVAILNGQAVGQIIATKETWACQLRMLFVTRLHRHKGIGSRLVSQSLVFAHNEGCKSAEIAVHKGNAEGRRFWIRRKFIDIEGREPTPDYICMERAI